MFSGWMDVHSADTIAWRSLAFVSGNIALDGCSANIIAWMDGWMVFVLDTLPAETPVFVSWI